jgi:hypothetical protein
MNPFTHSLRVLLKAGQGARLHAIVYPPMRFVKVIFSARRCGNLIEKGEIASVPSQ